MRTFPTVALTALLLAQCNAFAYAADASPAPSPETSAPPATHLGGFVEAAYHANPGQFESDKLIPLRSYDAYGGNNFILHAAHLSVSHTTTPGLGAAIEIDAGQDAGVTGGLGAASGGPQFGWFDVQEAFVKYTTESHFVFTAGKFATYEGIELLSGPKNPTLTRGFLFNFAEPFTHVGVKAHYAPEGPLDVGVGVVNGWDAMLDNNDSKTVIFRVGVTPSAKYAVAFSGTYGAERPQGTGAAGANTDRRLSLDMTGSVTPTPSWAINFQANYGQEPNVPIDVKANPRLTVNATWLGFGVQPLYTHQAFSCGGRVEWFTDPEGVRALTPNSGSYMNFTLTPGYAIAQNLVLRGELRLDTATEKVLTGGKSTQTTLALGAHYLF